MYKRLNENPEGLLVPIYSSPAATLRHTQPRHSSPTSSETAVPSSDLNMDGRPNPVSSSLVPAPGLPSTSAILSNSPPSLNRRHDHIPPSSPPRLSNIADQSSSPPLLDGMSEGSSSPISQTSSSGGIHSPPSLANIVRTRNTENRQSALYSAMTSRRGPSTQPATILPTHVPPPTRRPPPRGTFSSTPPPEVLQALKATNRKRARKPADNATLGEAEDAAPAEVKQEILSSPLARKKKTTKKPPTQPVKPPTQPVKPPTQPVKPPTQPLKPPTQPVKQRRTTQKSKAADTMGSSNLAKRTPKKSGVVRRTKEQINAKMLAGIEAYRMKKAAAAKLAEQVARRREVVGEETHQYQAKQREKGKGSLVLIFGRHDVPGRIPGGFNVRPVAWVRKEDGRMRSQNRRAQAFRAMSGVPSLFSWD
ncbi:hypothetical protein K505DRAFT_366385 [Melanomma pulvis-pyrius CBS 109.77]|uniref:Uncharacterized protein n=1 Tax=Melanomma pulvis-pyrius CBS 109.77 TaxID=1314802 RepID=A0A6A6WWR4_9PLEO|nr:hypothetical protein K505DRAFT_366385 [Melanomma pulvis-pyrius CBS 109.77]